MCGFSRSRAALVLPGNSTKILWRQGLHRRAEWSKSSPMPIGNTGSSFRLEGVQVVVYPAAAFLAEVALIELRTILRAKRDPLVGFASGGTYRTFFKRLADEIKAGRLSLDGVRATHIDEFLNFGIDRPGGNVHELRTICPPMAAMLTQGQFWPVPYSGDATELLAFEEKVVGSGVALQFLGLGRNGSLGFNEPGADPQLGFHRARLSESSRLEARARFAPGEPPFEAITSGPRTILAANRVVLIAHGASKASAVRDMLEGSVGSHCPAGLIRNHSNALVVLDQAAASELRSLSGAGFES